MAGESDTNYKNYIESQFTGLNLPFFSTGEIYSSEDSYENKNGFYGELAVTYSNVDIGNDDIIEGAHEMDVYDTSETHNHYQGVSGASNFYHHFWEADTYDNDNFNDGLDDQLPPFTNNPSTITVAEKLWNHALQYYSEGNKDKAYYYLGRIVHLLEDMGTVPHVHNDPHPSSDAYEDIMGKVAVNGTDESRSNNKTGKSIYLNWSSDTKKIELKSSVTNRASPDSSCTSCTKLSLSDLTSPSGLIIKSYKFLMTTDTNTNKAYSEFYSLLQQQGLTSNEIAQKWLSHSDLFRLFYSMAEITDDFPSDNEDGDIVNERTGNELYNGVVNYYAPVIQPAIIEHIAGLYKLFWESTHGVIQLPDTGQTKCYREISPYDEIPCGGTGQDGEYNINPMSFTDNGNGTVTDNNTGLMWQKCSTGQNNDAACSGTALSYNWYQASGTYDATYNPTSQDVCGSLVLGDYSDWRLPSKRELMSIVDYSIPYPGPTINTIYFPNTISSYWSSTTDAYKPYSAWYMPFIGGDVYSKDKHVNFFVQCVRGGQNGGASYVNNSNGTVTDNRTGLVWQQGEPGYMRWDAALSYCEGLPLGGKTDWRLPNIKELESLTDDTRYFPAIDTTFFPGAYASYYWSSTTYAFSPNYAWDVNFYDGSVDAYPKVAKFYVRCVRGGQSGSFDYYCDNDNDTYFDSQSDGSCTGSGCVPSGCQTTPGNDCDDRPNGADGIAGNADDGANIKPGAVEICNGIDDNCDVQIDEGLSIDADGDGHSTLSSCLSPHDDCNDNDDTIYPGASDVTCNGVDNDCDGSPDNGYIPTPSSCGVGECVATGQYICQNGQIKDTCQPGTPQTEGPYGTATCSDGLDNDCDNYTDANDSDCISSCVPTNEVCDGQDNDCDGQIDEGVKNTYYRDADSDGYGNPNNSTQACTQPSGYVSNSSDCNDSNPSINPGATEICNNVNDDCDAAGTDEGCDDDDDNYCDSAMIIVGNPNTCTSGGGDCNDSNALINPGAIEGPYGSPTCSDGQDNNCDGMTDSLDLNCKPYTISGYVRTSGGSAISGVTMSGDSCSSTDANGYYSCTVSSGWSGTITPGKTGYTFSPPNRPYSNVTSNQTNQDYTGTPPTVIYIEPSASCGVGNTPCYSKIQDGINASGDGTTIEVAQGTYHENIYLTSSISGLLIQGGWSSDFTIKNSDPSLTIINGDINGDTSPDGKVFSISSIILRTL